MLAPKLRHRITIEQAGEMRGPNGEVIEGWEPVVENEPAQIVPMSGKEFVTAQAVQAGVNTRILMRYRTGIVPNMRVLHDSVIYNIVAVLPDPTLRRHINLMCESGVNNG